MWFPVHLWGTEEAACLSFYSLKESWWFHVCVEWWDVICCREMGLEVVDLRGLHVFLLFPSHIGIKKTAFEAGILDLSMQNIEMLVFWWLASNLELAYPSEVYYNLSLMIGVPVIDGGIASSYALPPTAPIQLSPSLLPTAGKGIRTFEMCFDHQCSQKELTLHCPEMKGIRMGGGISVYRWCFVCIPHPLKRGCLDIIKRLIPKRENLWSFSVLLGDGRLQSILNIHKSLSSASFPSPFPFPLQKKKKRRKIWLLPQSRYKC